MISLRLKVNKTKNILIFYTIVLICAIVSSFGLHLIHIPTAKMFAGVSITIIPFLTVFTIIYELSKAKK